MADNRRDKPRWYIHLADFANMLKAFIGSNYLSVAYAFLQSGLGLGIIGLVIIASLTDHCCHLIVKTKHHAIRKLLSDQPEDQSNESGQQNYNSHGTSLAQKKKSTATDLNRSHTSEEYSPFINQESESEEEEDVNESEIEIIDEIEIHQHIVKHMTYGDIGKLAFGSAGVGIVNFCIGLTQFGFCVAYFIFIGNTVYKIFPVQECVQFEGNQSVTCHPVSSTNLSLDVIPAETIQKYRRDLNTGNDSGLLLQSTMGPNLDFTTAFQKSDMSVNASSLSVDVFSRNDSFIANGNASIPTSKGGNSTSSTTSSTTTISPATRNTTTTTVSKGTTAKSQSYHQSTAPDLKFLVMAPLPLFIIFAFIRSVRHLGVISVLANLSIFVGCVTVMLFLVVDFTVSKDYVWFNPAGFPVFFGMVTAAFEGIGLVIPIESSMEGNRHNFSLFLHGAIGCLSFILGFFACLGYVRFGSQVQQMLNTNIPPDSGFGIAVNLGVCVGVLLTFPLQIYPVIEILELYLFSEGRICGPKRKDSNDSDDTVNQKDDQEALLPKDNSPVKPDVATHVPASVSAWKRNILRIFIVLTATGLAVMFRNNFAYVGAFVGAVGSSLLAFILPCVFHLKLCWSDLPLGIKIKDFFIIIFGICASIISLYSVIERISNSSLV